MNEDYAKIREMLLNNHISRVVALGEAAMPHVVEALKDADWRIRHNAAVVLGDAFYVAAVPALTEALKDEMWNVRDNAAFAIGRIADAERYKIIIDSDESTRQLRLCDEIAALEAAAPHLINALKDCEQHVRWNASWALAKIAEKTEIDLGAIRTALKDFVESVRKKGGRVVLRNAEMEAARSLILISNAAAKFRASRFGEDGVILVGELPKPPSREKKMYREGARATVG